MPSAPDLWIGCAGWGIPQAHADRFSTAGSGLARYAARLVCTEVNSSFYRLHRPATVARWAAAVPQDLPPADEVTESHERTGTGTQLRRDRGG